MRFPAGGRWVLGVLLAAPPLFLAWKVQGKPIVAGPSAGSEMAAAANAFAAGLTAPQKEKALFPLEDASRMQWHYIPKDRPGLPLKQMTLPQRESAFRLLRAGTSATGYSKTNAIMGLERVLAEIENNPVRRDPDLYYVSIFGAPASMGTWGWKVEGHHISLNFTVVNGTAIATTPEFMGANPAEVRQGPLKGTRVLHAEEDVARELLLALDGKQRPIAVFAAQVPADILTTNASKVDPLAPAGIAVKDLTKPQRIILDRLLAEYAAAMPAALAQERIAKIDRAGRDKIYFAWAGGPNRGEAHYYRVQGPTFLIEYDNTQNEANHIHVVWRDFDGDFGRDLLREHYEKGR